jgi:hypothetical protein
VVTPEPIGVKHHTEPKKTEQGLLFGQVSTTHNGCKLFMDTSNPTYIKDKICVMGSSIISISFPLAI